MAAEEEGEMEAAGGIWVATSTTLVEADVGMAVVGVKARGSRFLWSME